MIFWKIFIVLFISFVWNFSKPQLTLALYKFEENTFSSSQHVNVTPWMEIAHSPSTLSLSPEEITNPKILKFLPIQKPFINETYTSKIRWIKIHLQNPTSKTIERDIIFSSYLAGEIKKYHRNGQVISSLDDQSHIAPTNGGNDSLHNFKNIMKFPTSTIRLGPGEEFIEYWAIQSRHILTGEFQLTHTNQEISHSYQIILTFYIGGILCLFFYNFISYFFTRENVFIILLVYKTSTILFLLVLTGVLDRIFEIWLTSPPVLFSHYAISFAIIINFFGLIFNRKFLPQKKHLEVKSKLFYYSLLTILIFQFIFTLTKVHDFFLPFSGYFIDTLLNIATLYCIYSGLTSYKENRIYSIIYLLSWFFIIISILIWFFSQWGIIPSNIVSQNLLLLGNLMQMTTLSIGLNIRHIHWQKEKNELLQKNKEKDNVERLLKVLTHDLANPLTLILAHAKKLYHNEEITKNNYSLEKIIKATENMANVVKNVRDEQMRLYQNEKIEVLNIQKIVGQTLFLFEDKIQKKELRIIQNIDPTLQVRFDQTILINNVFGNVLQNSIKFTPRSSKIFIHAFQLNEEILVDFIDQGIGIDPQLILEFQEHHRIKSHLGTEDELGSGFGLNIAFEYSEKYHTKMIIFQAKDLNDDFKNGTCVRFIFPKI